jgi:hypothetical protein
MIAFGIRFVVGNETSQKLPVAIHSNGDAADWDRNSGDCGVNDTKWWQAENYTRFDSNGGGPRDQHGAKQFPHESRPHCSLLELSSVMNHESPQPMEYIASRQQGRPLRQISNSLRRPSARCPIVVA